ncbi:hypothetical protein K505DRAFT_248473 [Melanomma pulvis-pyrius CBS 109.77]|uniref:N-acetyltransferase domain-containing protein n=1 Tax=Melanomma pulvis-pyrius CBS 109.77 TaxID=1314802 RepID=A0A6A6X6V0_9PLEO|nr:hypothetical protein K505DRAFT_248473 [Melanomma pulvis-pyrius CBS 109.77]
MPLVIREVSSEKDFDKISPMDYDAWQVPYNPQLKHFRPSFPTRDEAIADKKRRSIEAWKTHNPKKFYLMVEDTDADDVIGFALWEVNDKPEPYGEPTVAHWHPEGSVEKEFAERFINGLWNFIGKRVTRPHMDLLSLVVNQAYRGRGAGRLLIEWGTAKADELGIETVVSSLPSARGAYEKCGLGPIEIIPADVDVPDPSPRWKELQADDLSGWLMWRPIRHDYDAAVDKAPWLS